MIDDSTTFKDACNIACRELPEGWTILIELDCESGCVTLVGENGTAEFPANHENIAYDLRDAIEEAIAADRSAKPKSPKATF